MDGGDEERPLMDGGHDCFGMSPYFPASIRAFKKMRYLFNLHGLYIINTRIQFKYRGNITIITYNQSNNAKTSLQEHITLSQLQ